MGRLVDLNVAEGQAVREGEVLARIDPVQAASEVSATSAQLSALESERAAAEARREETAQAIERARALFAQGLVPKAELESAEAAAETARAQAEAASRRINQGRAQLSRAQDTLAKTEVTAPMAGVVTRLSVREGEMVVIGVQNQPGSILMTVSDLSAINAEVKVAEADVLRLAVGQQAFVTLDAAPGRELPGKVVEIGASALPTSGVATAAREFRVVIRLDQADAALRPGLTCDVRILAERAENVLTAPLQAVVLRRDEAAGTEQQGVFLFDAGKARFVPVELGILGGLEAVVTGAPEGAQVIAGPFQLLRELQDGDAVRPRAADKP
jgi:HlyD family secretion protein